jgi:hypothetical protein
MRRLFVLLALASCLSVPAFPDSLIQIQAQNYAGLVDLIGLHPFDPSLGTLDSVSVSIIGNITGYITTIRNYGGLPYSVTISQNFGPGPFFFYAPAQTTLSGMSAGVGETIPFSLVFTYGFTFDSLSNLTGLANGSGGIGGLPPAPFGHGRHHRPIQL